MWPFKKKKPAEPPLPSVEHRIELDVCEALEQRIAAIRKTIGQLPPVYVSREPLAEAPLDRFDANRWFEAFDLLRLRNHQVLDFAYHFHGNGGSPILYTRTRAAKPFATRDSLPEKMRNARGLWLTDLEFELSPAGFLQFAVALDVMPQFYLSWHSNSYDVEFILSEKRRDEILAGLKDLGDPPRAMDIGIKKEERQQFLQRDLRPTVRISGNKGEVTVTTFTKWGGFKLRTVELEWPNKVGSGKEEVIVAYNCMIRF